MQSISSAVEVGVSMPLSAVGSRGGAKSVKPIKPARVAHVKSGGGMSQGPKKAVRPRSASAEACAEGAVSSWADPEPH